MIERGEEVESKRELRMKRIIIRESGKRKRVMVRQKGWGGGGGGGEKEDDKGES